jgi:uncharacterized protein YukE
MTTLYMDVSAMRAIQRELEKAAREIERQLVLLRRDNQILHQNTWIANSANQYHAQFSDLTARLNNIAKDLQATSSEISAEIAHWENMDKKFG